MVRQAAEAGERYEIAFVDWQMPGMNGIETGKRILGSARSRLPPHLVMVTAYGREEVLKQAEESGFENVLIKPVTSSILFDTAVVALGADGERTETAQAGPSFDIDPMRGARILLVEDNEINQEVAMGQLEDAEAFVDLAENGEVALRMIARQRLRRRADGHADAGDGRHRGDPHHQVQSALRELADYRHDRQRHGLRPHVVPRGGHERPHRQADRSRPAVRRAAPMDPSRRAGRQSPKSCRLTRR